MTDLRARVFAIIQPADGGNLASRLFDFMITALVLVSVIGVFAVTFEVPPRLVALFAVIETVVSIVFTVEYALRLLTADYLYQSCPKWQAPLRYALSGMAIIDLLAILPFYLPMLLPCNLLAIRIFRLLRLLRLFKLNRYFESLALLGRVIKAKGRELVGSLLVVVLMLVFASLIIYAAEHDAQPEAFRNAFSGLWWAVATLTTVGYGDIYPVTIVGRIFGATIALLGIGMVAIPTGIISSGLVEQMSNKKVYPNEDEKHYCPYCGKKIC